MAIAFDAQAHGSGNVSTLTVAHTCSGSDRLLVVAITNGNASSDVSSLTYNSVAMTLAIDGAGFNSRYGAIYYLINPTVGTNNIVATMITTLPTAINSASFTGVDTAAVSSAHVASNEGNDTTPNVTMTNGSGNGIFDVVVLQFSPTITSANAGQTVLTANGATDPLSGASYVTSATANATLGWTTSGSRWREMAFYFPAKATINSNFLAFF